MYNMMTIVNNTVLYIWKSVKSILKVNTSYKKAVNYMR